GRAFTSRGRAWEMSLDPGARRPHVPAMQTLKLTYFDMHAGRGEVARIALFIGGVTYEDRRVKFQDWPAMKASTPFGAMPILEVDGQEVVESNGINRFVGKLTGLY